MSLSNVWVLSNNHYTGTLKVPTNENTVLKRAVNGSTYEVLYKSINSRLKWVKADGEWISYSMLSSGSAIGPGDNTGEMLYWDNIAYQWTHESHLNLKWDPVNHRLGINTNNPEYDLDVNGYIILQYGASVNTIDYSLAGGGSGIIDSDTHIATSAAILEYLDNINFLPDGTEEGQILRWDTSGTIPEWIVSDGVYAFDNTIKAGKTGTPGNLTLYGLYGNITFSVKDSAISGGFTYKWPSHIPTSTKFLSIDTAGEMSWSDTPTASSYWSRNEIYNYLYPSTAGDDVLIPTNDLLILGDYGIDEGKIYYDGDSSTLNIKSDHNIDIIGESSTSDVRFIINNITKVTIDSNGLGLNNAATVSVDTIETTLTNDDTHIPTSGAVWDALTGNVSGTGVDNQLAIWSGTNTLDGSSKLTYDGSTFSVDAISVLKSFYYTGLTSNTVVSIFSSSLGKGANINYVVENGGNMRMGSIIIVWNTTVEFSEFSTNDIGDASGIAFTVTFNSGNIILTALITSGTWSVNTSVNII